MFCPICRKELVVIGHAPLETLSEHVTGINPSVKAKYGCVNSECIAKQDELVWSKGGEYFGPEKRENWFKKYPFIDNNNGPFGSFSRRLNVEVYYHGEDRILINRRLVQVKIKYLYEANDAGYILKRKAKLEIWKRDESSGSYFLYIPGVHMLIFSIRSGIKAHKRYKRCSKAVDDFKEAVQYCKWDKRWWHLLSVWLLRRIFWLEIDDDWNKIR